jgi:hypothetical protein
MARSKQQHRLGREPLAISRIGVVLCLIRRVSIKNCHQLIDRCAFSAANVAPNFSEAMRAAIGQASLVAPIPHLIAKALRAERLAESVTG